MAYNSTNPNGQATSANSAPIVIASDQSTIKIDAGGTDGLSTGSLSSAASVTTGTLSGVSSGTVQVTGTWAGTLVAEASVDLANFVAIGSSSMLNINTGAYSSSIASGSTGIWQIDIAGFRQVRIRMSTYTSGTASISIRTSIAAGMIALDAPLPSGTNSIGNVTLNTGGNVIGSVGLNTGANTIGYTGLNPLLGSTGLTPQSSQSLTNTVIYIKATAARMFEYDFYNPNASGVWVQLFNAGSGVTLGSTTPTRTIYIPPTSGRDYVSPYSISFTNGLAIACTTTNTGSTAPSSAIQAYVGYV